MLKNLQPATKVVLILFFMMLSLFVKNIISLTFCFVIFGFVVGRMEFSGIELAKKLKLFSGIVIFTFLVHCLFGFFESEQNFSFIKTAIFFSVRIGFLLISSYFISFLIKQGETLENFSQIFAKMTKFIGVNVYFILTLAMRFFPMLVEESNRIREAQILRGLKMKNTIFGKAKSLPSLVIPLFTSAFHRARSLTIAIESRGFVPGEKRTFYKPMKFRRGELILMFGLVMVLFFVIIK